MKVAIIGCGNIAAAHLAGIKKAATNAELYFADAVADRAETLASKWPGSGIYKDVDKLLAEVDPDTAHILTPPDSHYALSKQAIEAGCHVLVEKPVTDNAREFLSLATLAEKQGKVLAVNYSMMGMPVVVRALSEIGSGKFGQLVSVHCNYLCAWPGNSIPYGDPHHWAYRLKGGILRNMADHPASLVLSVMNPVEEYGISAMRRNLLPQDSPDLLHVVMQNEDQVGTFTLSLGHGQAERRVYFQLERGTIMIDLGRQLFYSSPQNGPPNFAQKTWSGIGEGLALISGTVSNIGRVIAGKLQKDPGIVRIVDNFYRTIAGEEQLLFPGEKALEVVKLLEAVWNRVEEQASRSSSNHSSEIAATEERT